MTLFNFNLFQSTFDVKTGVKNVYFKLLHYLYMSLHGFVILRCGYCIKFELFSSPKGREFDQKIAKKFKCRTFARTPPPLRLSIDTCISKLGLVFSPLSLHTVKFELTNQHSVGGKNCGVLTSRRFCALRFDFCVKSVLFQRFLQIYHLPYFNLFKVTTVCNYMNWIRNQNRFKTFFCGGRHR